MKVVYVSLTGNVKSFVEKLNTDYLEIITGDEEINEEYIVITNTLDNDEIDFGLEDFLENNNQFLRGVAASGSRAYGENFVISADTIAKQYNVPIIHKFEGAGTSEDIIKILEFIK